MESPKAEQKRGFDLLAEKILAEYQKALDEANGDDRAEDRAAAALAAVRSVLDRVGAWLA